MSDKKPCPHPFTSWRTAGMTYEDIGGHSTTVSRQNLRTFVWCEQCGALGVQKEGKLDVEWRSPERLGSQ